MREIKFRGLDKKGNWHYGFYWEAPDGTTWIKEKISESHYADFEVIRETVGQFINLPDKNGKEIYDGDIVKCHKFTQELGENLGVREGEKEFIAEIVFDTYGGTRVKLPSGGYFFVWEYEEGWHEESLEVIGNIYENPELL